MALFKNAATEWEKTMTENDLDQMEAQGLDVSKYREKLAARRAKEAEEAKRDRELYKNPTQLDKMKPYMQTPRSSETEFFKKLAGKAPVIAAVGHRIKDIMVILILGMMFSSGVSAVVQILQYLSKEEALKAFVIWTMGSLGDVTVPQLAILLPSVIVGLLLAVWTIKPLNLLLFGEEYAVTMGLNIRRSRGLLFLSTTLLAGTVTAFCGPIGFIGLAMPHVARMLFREADHRVLLPGTLLSGAAVLLLCDIVSKMFTLPVNAITALLGIPIVVWVVLRNKSMTV